MCMCACQFKETVGSVYTTGVSVSVRSRDVSVSLVGMFVCQGLRKLSPYFIYPTTVICVIKYARDSHGLIIFGECGQRECH